GRRVGGPGGAVAAGGLGGGGGGTAGFSGRAGVHVVAGAPPPRHHAAGLRWSRRHADRRAVAGAPARRSPALRRCGLGLAATDVNTLPQQTGAGMTADKCGNWVETFPGNLRWSNATQIVKGMVPWAAAAMGEIDAVIQRLKAREHDGDPDRAWREEWSAMGDKVAKVADTA